MFGYIVIVYIIIQSMHIYNVYEFDRNEFEEKCFNKQDSILTLCDCWYMFEKFDTKHNGGNRGITNQIPVICKMRNKAYHMFD
jgi:hypothetical protein